MPGPMRLENLEIRSELRRYFITNKLLSKYMGIHEVTLCHWLQAPLTEEKEQRIRSAMNCIIKNRMEGGRVDG